MIGTSQRRRLVRVGGGDRGPARAGMGIRAIGHDEVPSLSDAAVRQRQTLIPRHG
jgi:hypothetical protein